MPPPPRQPARPLTAANARKALQKESSKSDALFLQRFFKTGPGEYAEGDRFIGVRVPAIRRVARAFRVLPLRGVLSLLRSPVHEERLLALFILTAQYERGTAAAQAEIYRTYLAHTAYINNWDLIDLSAIRIVGAHLAGRSRRPLYKLAKSRSLWERRIAIIATFEFIRRDDFEETLALADVLRRDPQDLIHKAVGWMLREVGNRDRAVLEGYLASRYQQMPRTMLRYAIEKFPERRRQTYLKGKV